MTIVALVAVVLVPFALMWWAGRDLEPNKPGERVDIEHGPGDLHGHP